MAKHLALLPQQDLTSLSQLSVVIAFEGIQCSGQDGLLGKLRPPPSTSQSQIGSQTRVDLRDGATSCQDADKNVLQLLFWLMVYRLDRQIQLGPHRLQQLGSCQTVSQHAQRDKPCLFGHCDQSNDRSHGTPPYQMCRLFYLNC